MSRTGTEGSKRALDLVGHRLMGRYRIERWIARGGMAVVFRGEDERLHRPVCVKLFHGFDPDQPEFAVVLEHFVQEAFALSRLRHPSTLRIYDFGYLDEDAKTEPFFVTEFADSGHLGQRVENTGGLPPAEVLQLLRPIVGALREAHAAGIVHRDLKPSNILLSSAGGELSPKLADFSIAKAHADLPNRASETNAQAPLYSLSWAAPEQLASGIIGPGADIFALGLLAAYLLTETLVYPGDDVMELYTLRSEGPEYRRRAIRELGLPPAIEEVILTACAEDPALRQTSIEEMYEALARAVERSRPASAAPELDYEDDEPTGEHQVLVRSEVLAEPPPEPPEPPELVPPPLPARANPPSASVTEPIQTRPQLLPPVSPANPTLAPPHKPHLSLDTLGASEALVGTRRLRLVEISNAPLELPRALAGQTARLRVTPQELGRGRLHIKGLNCFVARPDGRPSSGLDIDHTGTLTLLEPRSGMRGELRIAMGSRTDGGHELELRDFVLVLPPSVARWAAVLEAGDGSDPVLLYSPAP